MRAKIQKPQKGMHETPQPCVPKCNNLKKARTTRPNHTKHELPYNINMPYTQKNSNDYRLFKIGFSGKM